MKAATKNRVLMSMPQEARDAVTARCERVNLEQRVVLDRVGHDAEWVHFPETCVISTVASYRDGATIEMANIGREACTGLGLALGHPRQLNTNEVQIGGAALRLRARDFVDLKTSLPDFERSLFSTVQAVFYQVMVSGACNGAHDARERLARWLLTMHDRNDRETMVLTHDFLSEILGVRRATVSEAAAGLRSEGLISYSRGRISITDRAGLQGASCECYDLVREGYASLLPERVDAT